MAPPLRDDDGDQTHQEFASMAPIVKPCMTDVRRGRVLMFHGWAQNANVLRMKTKALTKKLNQAGYDVVFLEGPHLLPMTSTDERENAKAWFLLNANDPSDASLSQAGIPLTYVGLDESLLMVEEELHRYQGGDDIFTAILGFSQGAVFCHVLSVLAQRDARRFGAIGAVMLASGFAAQHVPDSLSALYNTGRLPDRDVIREIPSLHLIGKHDTSVDPTLSLDLVDLFSQGQILWHEKGHIVPQKSAECANVIAFLDNCQIQQQSSPSPS